MTNAAFLYKTIGKNKLSGKNNSITDPVIIKIPPPPNETAKAINLILNVSSSSILVFVIDKIMRENINPVFEIVNTINLSIVSIFNTHRKKNKTLNTKIPKPTFLKYVGNKRKPN